jgi:Zn-finger nucleic acid-binding protein
MTAAIICPVCQAAFKEVVRDGILIDVCTRCRGVWLDRGELEKLLAVARADEPAPPSPPPAPNSGRRYRHDDDHDDHDDDVRDRYYPDRRHSHPRSRSKLQSFFDVFD